jgi:rare lipoprotein A
MHHSWRRFVVLGVALSIAACGGPDTRPDGPGSAHVPRLPGDAVPREEPRSRYGNGPIYEVFNKRYSVLRNSVGYQERGVASWYGKKFHGKLTSNREQYDMYAMSGAHKTLPLPTFVRVRNLRNNKTVIVRINDRGPFVSNRIIDLSYAAAMRLDMVRDGTSLVEVTAISFDAPPRGEPPKRVVASRAKVDAQVRQLFVQVGAFGDRSNARRRLELLSQHGLSNAFVFEDDSSATRLFRVRIGPVADVVQYDALVAILHDIGITDPYLISE